MKKIALDKWSFKRKLTLAFFVSIIFPLVLMAVSIAAFFSRQIRSQDRQAFTSTLYAVAQSLETYLDDLQRFSLSPNIYPELMETYVFINDGEYDLIPDPLAYNQIIVKYRLAMQKLLGYSREDVYGQVFIPMYNPNSNMYVVSRQNTTLQTVPMDPAVAEEWIALALEKNGGPVFSPAHTVSYYDDSSTVFSVICLVKDVYKNQNIGIVKADILSEQVEYLFDSITTSPNSMFILLDQNQTPIYTSGGAGLPDVGPGAEAPFWVEPDPKEYTMYQKEISAPGWTLVYLSSERDVVAKMVSIYWIVALLGCLAVTGSALLFHLQSRRMSRSLTSITGIMKQAGQGDLTAKVKEPSGVPEFDAIGAALNQMMDRLDLYIRQNYQTQLSLRTAEYNALQAQVNPHFLYNTLNGFIALNRIGEKQLLEDSIIMLTRMFRYSCSGSGISTIREEFEFLEQYLYLQKLRYENRLDYQAEMAPGTEEIALPKLLIQPLVENSILHGMENCPHPVMIVITADMGSIGGLGNCVMIHVSDNGVGFDSRHTRQRVGLANVKERIELFDRNAFFEVKSQPGQFTRCTLAFTCEETEVNDDDG